VGYQEVIERQADKIVMLETTPKDVKEPRKRNFECLLFSSMIFLVSVVSV
jgi:hypothetical protein